MAVSIDIKPQVCYAMLKADFNDIEKALSKDLCADPEVWAHHLEKIMDKVTFLESKKFNVGDMSKVRDFLYHLVEYNTTYKNLITSMQEAKATLRSLNDSNYTV